MLIVLRENQLCKTSTQHRKNSKQSSRLQPQRDSCFAIICVRPSIKCFRMPSFCWPIFLSYLLTELKLTGFITFITSDLLQMNSLNNQHSRACANIYAVACVLHSNNLLVCPRSAIFKPLSTQSQLCDECYNHTHARVGETARSTTACSACRADQKTLQTSPFFLLLRKFSLKQYFISLMK